jgi:hypothetical protein
MKLVKKFESYVKKRYAGAESKKFKFKFENTGGKRGYRVTWCPDWGDCPLTPSCSVSSCLCWLACPALLIAGVALRKQG